VGWILWKFEATLFWKNFEGFISVGETVKFMSILCSKNFLKRKFVVTRKSAITYIFHVWRKKKFLTFPGYEKPTLISGLCSKRVHCNSGISYSNCSEGQMRTNEVAALWCWPVPSPRGASVGLAPPSKAPIPPKLKRETL